MTHGDVFHAQFICPLIERAELDHAVAPDAGVRRPARGVFFRKEADDVAVEAVQGVQHFVRDAERGADAARILGGFQAAAGLERGFPGRFGHEAQRQPHAHAPLLYEQRRRDGAVHPAAQRDEDSGAFGGDARISSISASRPLLSR